MIRLCIALLFLAGCGSHGHHAKPPPVTPPASTAFADIAGNYLATVTFATGLPFTDPVNETYTVTVAADGQAVAVNRLHTATITYHLQRMTDGTFATDPRPIPAGLTEFGTLPADMSTLHLKALKLWAGFTDQGILYGTEDLILVRLAPG